MNFKKNRKLSYNTNEIYNFTLTIFKIFNLEEIYKYLSEHNEEINKLENINNKNIFENYFNHIILNSNKQELFNIEKKILQKCKINCKTYNYYKTLLINYISMDISNRLGNELFLSDILKSISCSIITRKCEHKNANINDQIIFMPQFLIIIIKNNNKNKKINYTYNYNWEDENSKTQKKQKIPYKLKGLILKKNNSLESYVFEDKSDFIKKSSKNFDYPNVLIYEGPEQPSRKKNENKIENEEKGKQDNNEIKNDNQIKDNINIINNQINSNMNIINNNSNIINNQNNKSNNNINIINNNYNNNINNMNYNQQNQFNQNNNFPYYNNNYNNNYLINNNYNKFNGNNNIINNNGMNFNNYNNMNNNINNNMNYNMNNNNFGYNMNNNMNYNINNNTNNNTNNSLQKNNLTITLNDEKSDNSNIICLKFNFQKFNKELYLDIDQNEKFSKAIENLEDKYRWLKQLDNLQFLYDNKLLRKDKTVRNNGLKDLCIIDIDYNDEDDRNENDNEVLEEEDENDDREE